MNPECSCSGPGFCSRFNQKMPQPLYNKCKGIGYTSEESRRFRRDFAKIKKPPSQPGTMLAKAIKAVTFGLFDNCGGCQKRETKINQWWRRMKTPIDRLEREITVVCTAFRRPELLERFVKSVKHFYPNITIIIGDNGDEHAQHLGQLPGVRYHILPFDSGISATRNFLVRQVDTPYLLLCEDDFVFTEETRLDVLLQLLEIDQTVGCVGANQLIDGRQVEFVKDFRVLRKVLYIQDAQRPSFRVGEVHAQPCDMVFNFALFRREVFDEVLWDERLVVKEHYEFFFRLKKTENWTVLNTNSCTFRHSRTRLSNERKYHSFRKRDTHEINRIIRATHGLERTHGSVARIARDPKEKPNILVMGLPHSGTRLVSRALYELGWNGLPVDEDWAENEAARGINDRIINRPDHFVDNHFHQEAMEIDRLLSSATGPWVIKDPRFLLTLEHWVAMIKDSNTWLIWVTRDLEAVAESFRRRGERTDRIRGQTPEEAFLSAGRQYANWPWPKQRAIVPFEQIERMVQLWDPNGKRA